jgi:hypothetical protein
VDKQRRQAGAKDERTKAALEAAEELIGKWDQEGGMTYRELAARLGRVFGIDERLNIEL